VSETSMPSAIRNVEVTVDVGADVRATNIAILDCRKYAPDVFPTKGQAQIHVGGLNLHVVATPDHLRRLAKVIEDTAMELERQLTIEAEPATGPEMSPAGDRRERSVPCSVCTTDTWNLSGRCDAHLGERVSA
jgi:hypothetical protein